MKKNYQQPQMVVESVETQQATMLLGSGTAPSPAPKRFAPPIKVEDWQSKAV